MEVRCTWLKLFHFTPGPCALARSFHQRHIYTRSRLNFRTVKWLGFKGTGPAPTIHLIQEPDRYLNFP